MKQVGPQSFIVIIPRYQEFTAIASKLASQNVHFVEIAGNDEVLLTAIAPRGFVYDGPAQVLFSAGMLTRPDLQRIALRSPVASLHEVLNHLADRNVKLEHIYDF